MKPIRVLGAAVLAVGALLTQPAASDVLSDKYAGKTVTLIYG